MSLPAKPWCRPASIEALEPRKLLSAVSWIGFQGPNPLDPSLAIDASFNDPRNWSSQSVPTAADDITIHPSHNTNITVDVDSQFHTLMLGGNMVLSPGAGSLSGGSINVTDAALLQTGDSEITATDGISCDSQSMIEVLTNGIINADLHIQGQFFAFTGGAIIKGSVIGAAGSALNIDAPVTITKGIVVSGFLTVSGGLASGQVPANIINAPTTSILAGGTATLGNCFFYGSLTNAGLLDLTSQTDGLIGVREFTQTDTGTLEINVGSTARSLLQVGGTSTLAGTLKMQSVIDVLKRKQIDTVMTYAGVEGSFATTEGLLLNPQVGSNALTVSAAKGPDYSGLLPVVSDSAIHGVPSQGVYPHQPPLITTRKELSVDVKNSGVIPVEGTVTVNLYLDSIANQNPHVLVASRTLPFKLRPRHILRITLTPDWTQTPITVPGSIVIESVASIDLPIPTDPMTNSFFINLGPRPPVYR